MWNEYKDLACKNGISYQLFNQRIKALGWDAERAATQKVSRTRTTRMPFVFKNNKEGGRCEEN